jgi:hypothetical protein
MAGISGAFPATTLCRIISGIRWSGAVGYGHKRRLYCRFVRRGEHNFTATSGRKTNFLVIPPVAKAHQDSVDGSKRRRNYEGF